MELERICKLIDTLIPDEGTIKDIVEGVDIFKIAQSQEKMKICYEKGIVFILQGKKEINLEDSILTYNYLDDISTCLHTKLCTITYHSTRHGHFS